MTLIQTLDLHLNWIVKALFLLWKKVLDLIHTSIVSEGGDGDALWLSKHTSLDDLIPLIEEYNNEHKTGWKIEKSTNHILRLYLPSNKLIIKNGSKLIS